MDGCRDPLVAIGAFGGVALGGVAIFDWHYALEYVGTVGILLTFVNWLTSYDSPQVSQASNAYLLEHDRQLLVQL